MSAIASCARGTTPRARSRAPPCRRCLPPRWPTSPQAIAVVCEDARLSYRELDARSSQLAHHLRAHGVGPEVVVGLCLERSLDMLIALLGILKAGGAYLPLDPDYPPERLAFMLADARAPLLVTRAALRAQLPATDARILCLDAEADAIAAQPDQPPRKPTSTRKTPPMSSTPQAQPVNQKASPSRSAASPIIRVGTEHCSA